MQTRAENEREERLAYMELKSKEDIAKRAEEGKLKAAKISADATVKAAKLKPKPKPAPKAKK
jgi:hypothetical protein